jgi:hypothetical protein
MAAEHRQGDSWAYVGTASVKSVDGDIVDVAGWGISSQLKKHNGDVVADINTAWISTAEQTFSHNYLDTTTWPLGTLYFNIKLTSPGGEVISSTPAAVTITKGF